MRQFDAYALLHLMKTSSSSFISFSSLFYLLLFLYSLESYRECRVVASASEKMSSEDVIWNTDSTNALWIYKCITWATGTWPLQEEGIFSTIRFVIAFVLGVLQYFYLPRIENIIVKMTSVLKVTPGRL